MRQPRDPSSSIAFPFCLAHEDDNDRHTPIVGRIVFTDECSLMVKPKEKAIKLSTTNSPGEYVVQHARGACIATICQSEANYDLSVLAQPQAPKPTLLCLIFHLPRADSRRKRCANFSRAPPLPRYTTIKKLKRLGSLQ